MQPEAWATIGVGVTAVCSAVTGIVVAVVQQRRGKSAEQTVKDVGKKVDRLGNLVTPVSNGFADSTVESLRAIIAGQERMTEQQEQMTEQQVRMAEQQRVQAEISGRTVTRLDELTRHVHRLAENQAQHLVDHLRKGTA